MTFENLQTKALKLPPKDRAALAATLIASLDEVGPNIATPQKVKRVWMDEVDRRVRVFESGKVKVVPAAQVMARARKALQK